MTHFKARTVKKEEIGKWKLGKLTTDGVTENRIWSGYFNK